MRYQGNVYRPPSEANSYILQVTYGCSHNQCTFCGMYKDGSFSVRPEEEVFEDLDAAARLIPHTRRVFLADGDALVLSTRRLLRILKRLRDTFPLLERVATYAGAADILAKSPAELAQLRQAGLGIAYLGLESGSTSVLVQVKKGATPAAMIEAVHHLKSAGIAASVIGILGLAGEAGSEQHATDTASVIREMDPEYFAMLTLMLNPGTAMYSDWQQGNFDLMSPLAMLVELRGVIEDLEGLTNCVFRSNHASNYLPIKGTLAADRDRLLITLDRALAQGESVLRPEAWRGL